MGNDRFELQNVANTVEMTASSSKILQIARKTGRKADLNQQTQINSGSFSIAMSVYQMAHKIRGITLGPLKP